MKEHLTIRLISVISILLFFAFPLEGIGQAFQTKSGTVEFTSHVPLHTFTGTSNELIGQIDFKAKTVDFYVDLSTLKTGIGKRDKDMRTTLDVGKHPFAEFYGSIVGEIDLDGSGIQQVQVDGKFDVHGISRTISVNGTLKRVQESWELEAAWTLLLDEYEIEPPKLLIMKVDNRQEIKIKAVLKPLGK